MILPTGFTHYPTPYCSLILKNVFKTIGKKLVINSFRGGIPNEASKFSPVLKSYISKESKSAFKIFPNLL